MYAQATAKESQQISKNKTRSALIQRKETATPSTSTSNRTGIPDSLKVQFENTSGFSFDDVKVHYNSSKPAQLQALAYTQGNQVYIAPRQEKHLGHELRHVVQQKAGIVKPTTFLNGVAINDNVNLEKEADIHKFAQIKTKNQTAKISVAQRKVRILSTLKDLKEVDYNNYATMLNATANVRGEIFSRLYNHYINDREDRVYNNDVEFNTFMNTQMDRAHDAEAPPQVQGQGSSAQAWYDHAGTQGVININANDSLFIQIRNAVLASSANNLYPTDSKHEVVPSSPSPNIEVTRIQMIKNPTQKNEYDAAKQEISARTGDANANEVHLMSGHREAIVDEIARKGHRPDMGAYEGGMFGKGHGALGRGAYFTDNVNKAVSYARGPNKGDAPDVRQNPGDGTEHSFFIQDVLLGKALYGNYFSFRHSHHNEMVKRTGQPRAEGEATATFNGQPMTSYDSIVTAKTHQPGGKLPNIIDRAINNSFDSNEYLVRNPDQINVKFRVFYRLLANAVPAPGGPAYPLSTIGDVRVAQEDRHLPKKWFSWLRGWWGEKEQTTIGNPIL